MKLLALRIAAGLSIALSPLSAHADLQLSCPVRLDLLTQLEKDPDKLLFGVKVRDWKSEYFDALLVKNEECMAISNYPESVRKAERNEAKRLTDMRDSYLQRRDENLRAAETRSRTLQIVAIAKEQGIDIPVSQSGGRPTEILLYLFEGVPFREKKWECNDAGGSRKIGWLDEASIKKLAIYSDACLASGAIKQEAANIVKANVDALTRFYSAIPVFSKRVDLVALRPDIPPSALAELEAMHKQLIAPVLHIGFDQNFHPQLQIAVEKIKKLQAQLFRKTCDANYARANLPAAWRSAYLMVEWNNPTEFLGLVCDSMSAGVQIRYLPSGLFSKEGFEVKNAVRTVQVFPESRRIAGGDPRIPLLVPTAAKIDGKSYNITTQNIRMLYAELFAVFRNQ